ncbi:MAG: alpha-glucuronidase [Bacteroidales bacterium]|jgi:alpha-glucuronidase|nr:alpha-glucuronidase [Bacteroidales bacterium]
MKQNIIKTLFVLLLIVIEVAVVRANDGSKLWIGYRLIPADDALRSKYANQMKAIFYQTSTPAIDAAVEELKLAAHSMLLHTPSTVQNTHGTAGSIVLAFGRDRAVTHDVAELGNDGYLIRTDNGRIYVLGNTDKGVLYGTFHLIRLMQTRQNLDSLNISESPAYNVRILNHWDNLDRSVERGYAGPSIWEWDKLPDTVSTRYKEYARANAAIGINAAVLNNVNANANFITPEYLSKVKIIADILRPYGMKVYLSINFNSPRSIGGLETSDPLDKGVQQWWKNKVKEIYGYVPDFGGFLVKANSEGQPGPQDYGRSHVDGANMLAAAVKPHGGIIMWRAFVYTVNADDPNYDRAKQAYLEFMPFDGQFADNVIIQVKNGPIDFQPREPITSLFGAMEKTPLMVEFQITQEYLGHSIQLAYLTPMWKEVLDQDTYAKGAGSTVARVTEGKVYPFAGNISAISGVANTGADINWTGHVFAQSNWYGFGRLAWNPGLTSADIANDWIKQTFTNDLTFVEPVENMMLASYEAAVNYMQPLGLHHIFAGAGHYGPGVWERIRPGTRPDWVPEYYHRADSLAVGFDRTTKGTDYVSQYFSPLKETYNDVKTTPENMLLFFHRVPWNHRMNSGRTLWDELCYKYTEGLNTVREFQKTWDSLEGKIDTERFRHVQYKLREQTRDAIWWRDGVLLYFQSINHRPIPYELERPVNSLEVLMNHRPRMGHVSGVPGAPRVEPTSPMGIVQPYQIPSTSSIP